jgi:acyl-coenzyme A thioesterase 9
LREQYVNAFGGLRFGKILEDLDAFAAECAYVHADGFDPQRPVTIVTASCDRIDLLSKLHSDRDLIMEGVLLALCSSFLCV